MIRKAFSKQNWLFTLALVGLAGLMITIGVLLVMVMGRAWAIEHAFTQDRTAFRSHFDAWQNQNVADYTVTYSNCNPQFCCQRAQLIVDKAQRVSLTPACDTTTNTYYGYGLESRAMTMSELFVWINDQYNYGGNWDTLKISYHPELHYITHLEYRGWTWGNLITLDYENLRPR